MPYIISIAGLLLVLALAFVASSDRKQVKYKPIVFMILLQFLFGFTLLNTSAGNILISAIANGFMALLSCANEGVQFVFGGLANDGQMSFFLNVLMPITFISALIGILQHWKILPFISDVLPPLSLSLRSGGFLFDTTFVVSISKLSPCIPRFFIFYFILRLLFSCLHFLYLSLHLYLYHALLYNLGISIVL